MTTLIIGAGLVGSQIARILVEGGERPVLMDIAPQREAIADVVDLDRVTVIEGDVLRPLSLTEAIRAHGVTTIAHTAANPMLTVGGQRDPYATIQINIMGTVNVLEAARIHQIKRVVVSSSSVLSQHIEGGADAGNAMKEEAFPRPTTFYAATKQAIESIALNYARWNGVDFAGMRYAAVAGPWNGKGGGGPSNIFRAAVESALKGEEAVIPASGMDWIYSKDAAAGTVLALKAKDLGSRIFNLGMGRFLTPEDFAAALRRAIPGARTRVEPSKTSSAVNVGACDVGRARDVLGFTARFDLEASVRDLADFLRRRNNRP
jgi:nucleoside-diphosphate-sugar epimerase